MYTVHSDLLVRSGCPLYDRGMPQQGHLLAVLAMQTLIGSATLSYVSEPAGTTMGWVAWGLFLAVIPVALTGLVWAGWAWTAMACVVYGTIGLALDLTTVAGILVGGHAVTGLLPLSAASGLSNLLLIVFGGLAFVRTLQAVSPPGSRPPNPPSPSSTSVSSLT